MPEIEVKDVEYLVVHCSATKPNQDIGEAEIRQWHINKGWDDIGYHVIIRLDGTREFGRALDVRGAHVKGYNSISLGICMVGGVDAAGNPADTFSDAQKRSLLTTLDALHLLFPRAKVCGHRDFSPDQDRNGIIEEWEWMKACPSFSVQDWLSQVGRYYYYGAPSS